MVIAVLRAALEWIEEGHRAIPRFPENYTHLSRGVTCQRMRRPGFKLLANELAPAKRST